MLATLTLQNKQQRVNALHMTNVLKQEAVSIILEQNLSPMGHGKDLIAHITCHFESGIIVFDFAE